MGPLDFLRPFIAPIYSWSSAVGARGKTRLPWSMAFLFEMVARSLDGPRRTLEVKPVALDLGEAFRADAKAEGMTVVVGGWESLGGTRPEDSRWFSVVLDTKSAPWAFSRGEPFRTIAALEMFATLLSVVLFSPAWPADVGGEIKLTGATDNSGTPFAVSRLMTSKFPMIVILTELAEQLRTKGLNLSLSWTPRDQNEEADDLTNGRFGRFDLRKRMHVELDQIPWLILPEMLRLSEDLYREVQEEKAKPKKEEGQKRRKEKTLKETQPW